MPGFDWQKWRQLLDGRPCKDSLYAWKREGCPFDKGAAAVERWRLEHNKAARRKRKPQPEDEPQAAMPPPNVPLSDLSFDQLRTQKMIADIEVLQQEKLKLAFENGLRTQTLIHVSDSQETLNKIVGFIANALNSLPTQLAERMVGLKTPSEAKRIMTEELDLIRQGIAQMEQGAVIG